MYFPYTSLNVFYKQQIYFDNHGTRDSIYFDKHEVVGTKMAIIVVTIILEIMQNFKYIIQIIFRNYNITAGFQSKLRSAGCSVDVVKSRF